MLNRRDFLKLGGALVACSRFIASSPGRVFAQSGVQLRNSDGGVVNDIHSQLNPTRVDRIVRGQSLEELRSVIRDSRSEQKAISISGGRHAMGGQQFGDDN